jgi:hypothetical protein
MATRLRGQQIELPSLPQLCKQWPSGINPFYGEIAKIIEAKLETWIPDPKFREKLRKIDLATFVSR